MEPTSSADRSRQQAARTISVFIASPNDLAVERRAFKCVIDELNAGHGRGAKVCFNPLGWEVALSTVGWDVNHHR